MIPKCPFRHRESNFIPPDFMGRGISTGEDGGSARLALGALDEGEGAQGTTSGKSVEMRGLYGGIDTTESVSSLLVCNDEKNIGPGWAFEMH
jgi:hypothetical protein